MKAIHLLSVGIVSLALGACGSEVDFDNRRADVAAGAEEQGDSETAGDEAVADAAQSDGAAPALDPSKPVTVRGRWSMQVSAGEGGGLSLATSEQSVAVTVAPSVLFGIGNGNLKAPASPNGRASHGWLDVSSLYDNNLRACGATAKDKCTTAVLRVYTTGVNGAGVWNALDGVGLPLSTTVGSDERSVGLGQTNAVVVRSLSLNGRSIVKLTDFVSTSTLPLPLAVDYTDAPAGSYTTKVVVEYVLQ